jgi:hypothetical protein
MTSHADASVPLVPHEFPNLLGYLMGPAARAQTDYTVDLTLFRRLLALGADTLTAIRCHARGGPPPSQSWHRMARAWRLMISAPAPTTRSSAACGVGGMTLPRQGLTAAARSRRR